MTNNGKRVAWVTGGGSGIGESGAEFLAADGWTVVVSGRRKAELDRVVANITQKGGKAEAIPLDVSNKADVNKAAEQIMARHGRIDLLVNSAGINVPKRSWADMELEGWDKLVEVNLNGVLYCMRAVLPAMRKQKDGCIINVASWAGRHVSKMPGPAYTTTKHAVLALTHSFNMDECINGLRACCLSPGEVATPILKLRAGGAVRGGAGQNAAARRLRPHHRLRRQHARAGLHERDPDQPDAQSRVYPDAGEQGLVGVAASTVAMTSGGRFRSPDWSRRRNPLFSRYDDMAMRPGHLAGDGATSGVLKVFTAGRRLGRKALPIQEIDLVEGPRRIIEEQHQPQAIGHIGFAGEIYPWIGHGRYAHATSEPKA